MNGVAFEWNIRAGDILTIVGMLAMAASFVYRRGRGESTLESTVLAAMEQIEGMKRQLEGLAEVVTAQAVQNNRIDNLAEQVSSIDRRVEDMRRGNGYIRGRTALDGEYP